MSRQKSTHTTQLRLVSKEGSPCWGKVARKPSRRLLLVDIENYCGKGSLCLEDVREAKESIVSELDLHDEDFVVIGTSHGNNCLVCGSEWKGPRQVMKHGHDGADIALVDASREYRLDTFASVIIVSGDGIFTDVASIVRANCIDVTVLSSREHLSRRLELVASEVKYVQPRIMPAA